VNIVIQLSFRFGPHSHRIPGNPSDHPTLAPHHPSTHHSSHPPSHRSRSSAHLTTPGVSSTSAFFVVPFAHAPRSYIYATARFRPRAYIIYMYVCVCVCTVYRRRRRNTVRSRPPSLHIYATATASFFVVVATALAPPSHPASYTRPMTERWRRRCRSLILLGKCNL